VYSFWAILYLKEGGGYLKLTNLVLSCYVQKLIYKIFFGFDEFCAKSQVGGYLKLTNLVLSCYVQKINL
jgi:hypothetical protein